MASIVRIAEDFYPKVINNMTVGGVQQIQLKTKVMEVSRTKLRQAGFDWQWHALIGNTSVGIVQSSSGLLNPAGITNLKDTVNFGIVDGNNAFYGYIDALRRNDLVKILAEPTVDDGQRPRGIVQFGRAIRHPGAAEPRNGFDRVQELRHASRLRSDRAGQRRHPPGSSAVGE